MRMLRIALVALLACGLVSCALAQEVKGKAGELMGQAQTAMQSGQYDRALSLLEQAKKLASDPKDQVRIAGQIALIQAAQGKYEEAKAYLTVQAEKTQNMGYKLELARLILRSDPSGVQTAADILKDVTTRDKTNVDAWIEYGRALARATRYTESVVAYERVTRGLNPKELRAHYGLTETFILNGLHGRARNVMLAALKLNPEAPLSYMWLARAYDRDRSLQGRLVHGIQNYERAYELDRSNAMYLAHVLFCLMNSENSQAAKSYARKLSKHAGDSVEIWFDSLLKELSGDVAGAVAGYQRAVQANPENIYAHFALANVYSGSPTPGFGAIRGPRMERWRYAPHRDLRKASQEVSIIKLLDPTFPASGALSLMVTERMAAEYPAQPTIDEAATQRINKMVGYYQHLMMTR